MNKEFIIENIRNGLATGMLSVDDVLIELNKFMEDRLMLAIKEPNGRIVFSEDYPRLVSCCFSEVLELDVKEIWLEDGLQFLCEEPETYEQYKLNADDFLFGELRHVIERLKKIKKCVRYIRHI